MEKLKSFIYEEEKRTLILLFLSLVSLIFSFFHILPIPFDWAWIAILLCGFPIVKGAIIGLVTEFDIKADVLVSIALVASVIIGEIFAAGEVAFIMTLGALLEEHTVAKARAGIEKLVNLTPRTGRVLHDGKEEIINAKDIVVGDILRVLPGEAIAVDGIILKGETSINQSIMTGESMPVDKVAGDEVFSGTVNQFGAFEMKATKIGEDSSLQRLIRLVESADAGKAKIVSLADRWATWIVVIALVSAALTWLVTGEILRSVTILVVFCPCALVLATPTAIMAGIGNAAKYGILIREGDALERLSKIKKITFDKTGTLTYGKPKVTGIHTLNNTGNKDELLKIAASLERLSEHPLGKAIVEHYKSVSNGETYIVNDFKMNIGKGVQGRINDSVILAGNKELLEQNSIDVSNLKEISEEFYQKGATVIYITADNQILGFLVLEDILRKDANSMVATMEKQGVTCVLLTGDHKQAAGTIANAAGINEVYAECLPEDKMNLIDKLQKEDKQVCMVGDGINDAPALKKAYVGLAMGGIGSDIAVDAADMVFINDDIKHLPHLLGLSKKTMTTITINLSLSMALNFAAIILAMTGILNPLVGALVHNVGSVIVIIHSSLLLNWKSK